MHKFTIQTVQGIMMIRARTEREALDRAVPSHSVGATESVLVTSSIRCAIYMPTVDGLTYQFAL